MLYILTPEQMRAADSVAINDIGVPGAILMENAARSCAEILFEQVFPLFPVKPTIILLCGSGNNGGDGFALARHLTGEADVFIYWIGKEESMSPETRTNFKALKKLNIPVFHIENEKQINNLSFECDILVDSLIGVGGSENLRGLVVPILQKANLSDSVKIAIDAPTGLNTETGNAHDDSFRADYTVTMFAVKTGMLLNEGMNLCGNIFIAGLGVPESLANSFSDTLSMEFQDLINYFPARKRISSKFDYGKILIIAGSKKYPGAAALTSNAAITCGAGLVKLFTTKIHHSLLPEVIPFELDSTPDGFISGNNLDTILSECEKSDVLVIGPGLGDNDETISLVKKILKKVDKNLPVIIDADGLRAIDKKSKLRQNIVLTPHTGEFSRIIGVEREIIEKDSLYIAREWSKKLNCVIVLKHVPVIISNRVKTYLNLNGNPGMATGGSGDVLTGIIASLVAQGLSVYDSAVAGVFIHAAAGDYYASQYSMQTLTATGIIDSLKHVVHQVVSE